MTTHTIDIISSCERRISITVNAKTVEKTKKAVAAKYAKNIKGFRPQSSVTQARALERLTPEDKVVIQEKLCKDSFYPICDANNIDYVWGPTIETAQSNPDGSFSYVALVETYPNISHVHWEGASLEKVETDITPSAISQSGALFRQLGVEAILESGNVLQWCEWIVDVFQHQQLRKQVMKILREQNQVSELPERLIETRYQRLKKEKNTDSDEQMRETTRQYIIADILFKAYASEHNIRIEPEHLLKKIEEAKKNPFIMSTVQNESQLPYYLGPRVFEEAIIQHLSERANCRFTKLTLPAFMALAFDIPEPKETKWDNTAQKDPPIQNITEEK